MPRGPPTRPRQRPKGSDLPLVSTLLEGPSALDQEPACSVDARFVAQPLPREAYGAPPESSLLANAFGVRGCPFRKPNGVRNRQAAQSHPDRRAFALSSSGGEGPGEEALFSILGSGRRVG
ncbi:hypothetical protein SBV1_220028 [Verrucomicrobia bacterium]|nr:hypothetical protein SBV1_220028 [Verrucomicrobiota bacterium]